MVLLEEILEDEDQSISPEPNTTDTIEENKVNQQAQALLQIAELDRAQLPDILHRILVEIIKPLFSTSRHPQLTSTGRKNQIPEPPKVGRFSYDALFDESQPWKNKWTINLLHTVLGKYADIPDDDDDGSSSNTQTRTIEAHFHLLIPPILNLIDDSHTDYKVAGCECLTQLCQILERTGSDMMNRTGLADVFVNALRTTFTYLPTLTPEAESLKLMKAVHPAFHALIKARFVRLESYLRIHKGRQSLPDTHQQKGEAPSTTTIPTVTSGSMTPDQISSETSSRQTLLTLLLRHSVIYGLSHLSTGTSQGMSTSPSISTYLVSQVTTISKALGIYTAAHLQVILPMIKNTLCDPFGTSVPEMLMESVRAMGVVINVCWPRVRDRWWTECLAGLVGCWMNIADELHGLNGDGKQEALGRVQAELKKVVALLADVVDEDEFANARKDLLAEDDSLREFFVQCNG